MLVGLIQKPCQLMWTITCSQVASIATFSAPFSAPNWAAHVCFHPCRFLRHQLQRQSLPSPLHSTVHPSPTLRFASGQWKLRPISQASEQIEWTLGYLYPAGGWRLDTCPPSHHQHQSLSLSHCFVSLIVS